MAAGNSYCLGIKSNDFFLKDNKKAFILWLNVPKVTAYYYRLLYRIMQTIDDANVDDDTKRRYAKIFRCQISEEELILLRYNASTHYGKKMQVISIDITC